MATDSSITSAFNAAAKGKPSFPADQLATAARAAGASPSLAELKAFASKCGAEVNSGMFADFCRKTSHVDSADDLLSLFQSMDLMGTGKVRKTDVKKCLMNFGEALSVQEADAVLDDIFPNQEDIDYQILVQKLLQ
ncbi:myosin light chain TgMLC1, putative [Eimeria necatrix]|uniref:Myosin light chain TgMLC1, putative n=1 Tax=Eimeria necatrix TaxID=51315 RepID=U6MJ35_9EIME|nr:myosin light chain TgMLC1, putative [Eimeria necatrix]CDJ64021.1 myosin light chain TgMLC1, putative [Eimeria necatrix]